MNSSESEGERAGTSREPESERKKQNKKNKTNTAERAREGRKEETLTNHHRQSSQYTSSRPLNGATLCASKQSNCYLFCFLVPVVRPSCRPHLFQVCSLSPNSLSFRAASPQLLVPLLPTSAAASSAHITSPRLEARTSGDDQSVVSFKPKSPVSYEDPLALRSPFLQRNSRSFRRPFPKRLQPQSSPASFTLARSPLSFL